MPCHLPSETTSSKSKKLKDEIRRLPADRTGTIKLVQVLAAPSHLAYLGFLIDRSSGSMADPLLEGERVD